MAPRDWLAVVECSRFVSIDNCITLIFCTWAYGYDVCVSCDPYLFGRPEGVGE